MKKAIVSILKKLHLYSLALMIYNIPVKIIDQRREKKNEKINQVIIENVSKRAKELITQIESNNPNKGIVYIFQQTYYTTDGKQYISGGGERYASDLAELIYNMGYQPILIQFGDPEGADIWTVKRRNLVVLGLNINWGLYSRVIAELDNPKLAIYSGFINYGKKYFSPNVVISHGITWDAPSWDVGTDYIKDILFKAETLVSVDTNTISWMRSTFSKTLSDKKVNMQYVPNYTDIQKYIPNYDLRSKDKIRVIFPRRCSPERGFWLITNILPTIMEKYDNVVFDYVGFIHTEDIGMAIEKLKSKYPGRVNHYFVDADEIYKIYQKADITLIPTLYCEGTSLSCIEAMACGNLVISTNIGGLPNLIIDGYNGRLINPDEDELLEALDETIRNEKMRKQMERNAVDVAIAFSKEKWEARWTKILINSMGGSN